MENPVKHTKEYELYPIGERRPDSEVIRAVFRVISSALQMNRRDGSLDYGFYSSKWKGRAMRGFWAYYCTDGYLLNEGFQWLDCVQ